MFDLSFTFIDQFDRITARVQPAAFKNFQHAAAAIRLTAIRSIRDTPGPSPPGSPPHTHTTVVGKTGKKRKGALPRSIAYDVSKMGAIIGTRFSVVGDVGNVFEFGGDRFGEHYDARPTMFPALEKNLDRFAQSWEGSLFQF